MPDMNEALNELNALGIIHRDIKPSNITQNADGSYVLMDFGISSVRNDKQSIIATQTGLTFVYAAPEALRDLWLVQSDYFSLGITIYELLTGVLPTDGMTEKELERYALTSKIPIPDSVPERLALLIRGLTYKDITNRKDKNNPNNRWVYEQVCDWLAGKAMVEPGAAGGQGEAAEAQGNVPPFDFMGQKYTDLDELFIALAENWDEGKKVLGRGFLEGYFRNNGMNTLAGAAMDAAEDGLSDRAYGRFLYENCSALEAIYWKGNKYSPAKYGSELIRALWKCREVYTGENLKNNVAQIAEPVDQGIIELFYRSNGGTEMADYIAEHSDVINKRSEKGRGIRDYTIFLYELSYALTGKYVLNIEGRFFESYDAFLDDFEQRLMNEENPEALEAFFNSFVYFDEEDFPAKLQFNVWRRAVMQ